ncbi:MAG: hypothetical protein K2Y32_06485 [Candidatus Obscuribacterales bacterium]|nr:hypothetical protein [Candidatus Obscuribacterales bacterium]
MSEVRDTDQAGHIEKSRDALTCVENQLKAQAGSSKKTQYAGQIAPSKQLFAS